MTRAPLNPAKWTPRRPDPHEKGMQCRRFCDGRAFDFYFSAPRGTSRRTYTLKRRPFPILGLDGGLALDLRHWPRRIDDDGFKSTGGNLGWRLGESCVSLADRCALVRLRDTFCPIVGHGTVSRNCSSVVWPPPSIPQSTRSRSAQARRREPGGEPLLASEHIPLEEVIPLVILTGRGKPGSSCSRRKTVAGANP
jgi:hypothetical protein